MKSATFVFLITVGMGALSGHARAAAPTAERPPDYVRLRTAVTGLLGWRVAIPSDAFGGSTLLEAAEKASGLGLGFVEGVSGQKAGPGIAEDLGPELTPEDIASIKSRLAELKVKMPGYHAANVGSGEHARRLFEFAKALGVEIIVASPDLADLPAIDALANEYGIDFALENRSRSETPGYWDPKGLMSAMDGRSKRMGIQADVGDWMREGIGPSEGLSVVSTRLLGVNLSDRSALGSTGRAVGLGSGKMGLARFLQELGRLERPPSLISPSDCGNCSRALVGLKPLLLSIQPTGGADPQSDLSQSLMAFEKAIRPAMAEFVDDISRVTPITPTTSIPAEDRQKIEAALPREPRVKPKKPRKLLVLDLCAAGGYYHTTIAYANLALELMAKSTGAYEAVFSNDLDNLKYPKIKQFDAVFLNSTVGEDFIDPAVVEGLMRFVREGGGVAGLHGATYASMDIPAYGEMMGAQDGPHQVELATLKIDDPSSPITKPLINSQLTRELGGREFAYTDEFYHFLPTGPFSRSKLHVLLSIDVGKSDMTHWHVRPDNDYGLSWIRSYGRGRVFNCALGHTPTFFETPALAEYILSAIQFVLGDLPADTTPSAKLARLSTGSAKQ